MGNRAYIVFDAPKGKKLSANDALPAVYLHWNGGPESVYTFLAYCKEVCREGDAEYIPARFVQIVGNYLGNNLSLGLTAVRREDIQELSRVGDNGCYVVDTDTYAVTERHFENYIDLPCRDGTPWKEGVTFRREFKALTKEEIAEEHVDALAHVYNKDDKLLSGIREVNDPFFKKDYKQKVVVTLVTEETA